MFVTTKNSKRWQSRAHQTTSAAQRTREAQEPGGSAKTLAELSGLGEGRASEHAIVCIRFGFRVYGFRVCIHISMFG